MSKLKDMKKSAPKGTSKHVHKLNLFLESDKFKQWSMILIALLFVFLMVFSVFMVMF